MFGMCGRFMWGRFMIATHHGVRVWAAVASAGRAARRHKDHAPCVSIWDTRPASRIPRVLFD
jgi:hypothetical protein